jgi:anti-sigma factor RsiW
MSVPAADDGHTSSAARQDERNRARNDERRYMTLATRLAIAMILLVAIAVAAVGWLSYWSVEQAVLPRVSTASKPIRG